MEKSLKKELEILGLSITGNKAELQSRLRQDTHFKR